MLKPGDKLYANMRGIYAEGFVSQNGFTVLAGSQVRECCDNNYSKSALKLREQLIQSGIIKEWVFTVNYEFNSSSTAATVLLGSSASGPATWKDGNGISLRKLNKVVNGLMDSIDSEYTSFFRTVEGNEGSKCHYPTRLDTYGCGCGHDCDYCYAKDMMINHGDEWNTQNPKYVDLTRVENKLKRIQPGTILRLGGMTDCFQPIELQRRITLDTIKLMNKYGIGYLIVTKSHHVADKEYLSILNPDLAHIQITTTTFDEKLCAKHEKASAPSKRVKAIETLQSLGFDTFFRLSPYINGWIDFEILNRVKCDKILVEFLRVNSTIAKRFDVNPDDFPVREAGYWHYSLDHKLDVLSKITGFKEISVCDDNSEHYEYFRDHFNPNPKDCCNLRK